MFFLLEALVLENRFDAIIDTIRNYWGKQTDAGATTFWEMYHEPDDPSPFTNENRLTEATATAGPPHRRSSSPSTCSACVPTSPATPKFASPLIPETSPAPKAASPRRTARSIVTGNAMTRALRSRRRSPRASGHAHRTPPQRKNHGCRRTGGDQGDGADFKEPPHQSDDEFLTAA